MKYSSILNDRVILITGGTGSFGHQIVKELMVYKPKSIRIFSRDEDISDAYYYIKAKK